MENPSPRYLLPKERQKGRTEKFNGNEDRDYFTLEEGNNKIRISDNRGEIITTTWKYVRPIKIMWYLDDPAEKHNLIADSRAQSRNHLMNNFIKEAVKCDKLRHLDDPVEQHELIVDSRAHARSCPMNNSIQETVERERQSEWWHKNKREGKITRRKQYREWTTPHRRGSYKKNTEW